MPTEQDIQTTLQLLTGQSSTQQGETPEVMVMDVGDQQMEVTAEEAAAMGVGMAQHYMSRNGPVQPRHVRRQRVMTKAQLEEQKMNEVAGYPSNLDEAAKVKKLEQDVAGIQQGIGQILQHLNGGTNVPHLPKYCPPEQLKPQSPSSPVLTEKLLNERMSEFHEKYPNPVLDQALLSPIGSGLSTSPAKRIVHLSDGKTMEIPIQKVPEVAPIGLGPIDAPLVETPEVDDGSPDLWVEEPEAPVQNDPKAERLAFMIQQVFDFLRTRDPHRCFRVVLPRVIGRHVGFSCWPKVLQERFNQHFKTLLTDPVFLRSQVASILSFETGAALSAEKIAAMVTLSAGFMAFSLAGAEVNT